MNATCAATVHVVIDDVRKAIGYVNDSRTVINSADIVAVAVVAAKFFHNHHEHALCLLQQTGYLPSLSVSRLIVACTPDKMCCCSS